MTGSCSGSLISANIYSDQKIGIFEQEYVDFTTKIKILRTILMKQWSKS